MVFNATFNNISAISWRSVLLVEVTKFPDKTINLLQVTDKLYHIMLFPVHPVLSGIQKHTRWVPIDTNKLWIKMLRWKWCRVNMIFNKNNIRINRISCGNIIIYLKPYLIFVSQGWFQLENKITEITENQLKSSTPPLYTRCQYGKISCIYF